MKAIALLFAILLALAVPQRSMASIELGTPSTIALNLEQPHLSIGLGLSLRWETVHRYPFFQPADTSSYFGGYWTFTDATVYVLTPALATRFFLSEDRDVQPFIVCRAEYDLPIVSTNPDAAGTDADAAAEELNDRNDGWRVGIGAGVRSELNSRLAVGGEAVFRTTFRSFNNQPTDVSGGSEFLVFLQYRP